MIGVDIISKKNFLGIISKKNEEYRASNELLKKYFDNIEIKKAMIAVACGPLGKHIWIPYKVPDHYEYNDGIVYIYYELGGCYGELLDYDPTLKVNVNGKDIYFGEYDANFDESTLVKLRQVYEQHIAYKEKYEPIKVDYTKYYEIREVFNLLYPHEYIDDKIMINNIKFQHYESAENDCEGRILISGTIKLLDGTVLMDIEKDIYRPGAWVEYVCNLINVLKSKKEYESQLKIEENEKQQLQKKLELKRIFDINHSPVDDGKYFN